MSLTPNDDEVQKEMEDWSGFMETLRKDDRELFKEMFQEIRKYAPAIAAKGSPFTVEPLLMAGLLDMYKKLRKKGSGDDGTTV